MKKSDIVTLPHFYDRYINLVDDVHIAQALRQYSSMESLLNLNKLKELGDQVYAPGKWTVKQIIQHITDNERVQAYRALCFARNDNTPLPGYEENDYAANADTSHLTLDLLLEEFRMVRAANIALFTAFTPEMLMREGTCNNTRISVLGLGFVLAGHQVHHSRIIEERYFPLLHRA